MLPCQEKLQTALVQSGKYFHNPKDVFCRYIFLIKVLWLSGQLTFVGVYNQI